MIVSRMRNINVLLLILVGLVALVASSPVPQEGIEERGDHEKDPAKLAKKYRYYQRPLYRYPYYDQDGKGHQLYGYGGPELFSYSVFQPLEGYYKK